MAGQDTSQNLVGLPRNAGNSGDTKTLVHLGATRVVDTRHDGADSEGFTRDAGSQNVRVITARDSCERICALDPRLTQAITIEADPRDCLTLEIWAKSGKCLWVLIDHSDRMTSRIQRLGQLSPDATASHDDYVHE
jgi:hypothetical protein